MVAHCAHHLLTALPMPMLPFVKKEFTLNYTQSSFVTSAFAISSGTAQLPAGFLADRLGPRILITVGILGVALAGVLVGISQTYIMLIVFMVIMGLMAGGYHPAATPLISASVEPQKRGRALGFHLIGGNASFFLAPIIAAAIAGTWNWRGAFLGLAIPTAIFGIIFFILLKRQLTTSQAEVARRGQFEEPPPPGNIRRLVAFLALSVLGGGAGMSIMTFLALFAVDELHASEQTAASLLAIVFSAGIWASPVGGYISDRVGRVPIIIATSFISGVLVYVLPYTTLGISFYAVLFFMGINNAFRMPASEVFIMSQAPVGRRSTIYGVYYFTMQYTGAIFAPIMGYFIDHPALGYENGWEFCFTIASITVVVVTLACLPFLRGGTK